MNDDVLEQLRVDVQAPTVGHKVAAVKRLKTEICPLRPKTGAQPLARGTQAGVNQ